MCNFVMKYKIIPLRIVLMGKKVALFNQVEMVNKLCVG